MSADGYGFSPIECKIIQEQIRRRKAMREEFLRQRTDPYKHAAESGYVFDSAIQRFMSLKCTQYELFESTPRTVRFALLTVVGPMLGYGYLVWSFRDSLEQDYRCIICDVIGASINYVGYLWSGEGGHGKYLVNCLTSPHVNNGSPLYSCISTRANLRYLFKAVSLVWKFG